MNSKAWDEVAKSYFDLVVSPFQPGVVNPLLGHLKTIPQPGKCTVADLGCGIGNFLPFLAERFGTVYAVDFSAGMLREARKRHDGKNVRYLKRCLTDLAPLHGKLDVAIAVNSVLAPRHETVDAILEEILRTLKPGGRFAGVFPSMEAILYHGQLILDRELEKAGSASSARRRAVRIHENAKYDYLTGLYRDGNEVQKFYYAFELRQRLKRAGFKNVRLGKVLYPWDAVGDYEAFPGQPPMWDWCVKAERQG